MCNFHTYARLVGCLGPPEAEKFLPRKTLLMRPSPLRGQIFFGLEASVKASILGFVCATAIVGYIAWPQTRKAGETNLDHHGHQDMIPEVPSKKVWYPSMYLPFNGTLP